MATSHASTMTLTTMQQIVAMIIGAKGDPTSCHALEAIHMALDNLTSEEWNYYKTIVTLDTTVGDPSDGIASTVGTPISMRCSVGTPRTLHYVPQDMFGKMFPDQTTRGLPSHYTLTKQYTDTVVTFLPTPDVAELFEFIYSRIPAKSTTGGSPLDIATYMEGFIILYAQTLVATWRGARSEKISEMAQLAEMERRSVRARDREIYDEVVRFASPFEEESPVRRYQHTDDPSISWWG